MILKPSAIPATDPRTTPHASDAIDAADGGASNLGWQLHWPSFSQLSGCSARLLAVGGRGGGLVAACLLLLIQGQAADEGLRAGFARAEITPTIPVTLAGYASRKELSRGVHDPLWARAVAFERGGKHLVLVSTDILGWYAGTGDAFRKAILEECKLEPSELFLAAIHTHSAPSPALELSQGHSNNVAYTKELGEKLVRLVREALGNTTPVRVGAGVGASPVGSSRRQIVDDNSGNPKVVLGRQPSVPTDREVEVLRLDRADQGGMEAVLFAYQTHSTSLGPGNYLISGDVHGLAAQFLERYWANSVLVPEFAGASGDIDPWYRVLPGFNTTNGWIPEPVLLGTMLGEEVAHVAESIRQFQAGGPVNTAFETLELPGKSAGETKVVTNSPPTRINLTVGRIGDVGLVGLGGEVFNEIGRAIKAGSPFRHTLVITHCNGAAGYLPTHDAYLAGGYEVESSRFAPGAAEQVIKEALRLLHSL